MINISFFSYKGGSGRTTLTYNTMPFIIQELKPTNEKPIILLDMDIDSKGMSYLLGRQSAINTIQVLRGDFDSSVNPSRDIINHSFFNSLSPVGTAFGLPEELDYAVLFVSAHATNKDNLYISSDHNYDSIGATLKRLERLCNAYNCSALIMDTPTGSQLSSSLSLSISDVIVTVLRITKQFREGTIEFLQALNKVLNDKKFIIVPNAVPEIDGIGTISVERIFSGMEGSFKNISAKNEIIVDFLTKDKRGINEVQLFKLSEANLFLESKSRNLTADEIKAIKKYEELARIIVHDEK